MARIMALVLLLGMAILPAACSLIMASGIWFYDLTAEKLERAEVHGLAATSSTAGDGGSAGQANTQGDHA